MRHIITIERVQKAEEDAQYALNRVNNARRNAPHTLREECAKYRIAKHTAESVRHLFESQQG